MSRKSVTGYIITLCGGPVIWSSKRLATVALSSAEAEYVALPSCARDVIWSQNLLRELLVHQEIQTTVIESDSVAAIQIANRKTSGNRARHIDIKHHFVCDLVEQGRLYLQHTPSAELVADLLTKSLDHATFSKHRDKLVSHPLVRGSVGDPT
jgi:hypothetical protein